MVDASLPRTYVLAVRINSEAALELLWIDDECTDDALDVWRTGLAPEVELRVLTSAAARTSAFDVRQGPYAVLGIGPAVPAAVELVGRLAAARPAACLFVVGPARPAEGGSDCPVVAFLPAGAEGDESVGGWRHHARGGLCVRRHAGADGFRGRPGRETVLAVKEELRVWPN
jgi:hypothetical protein